MSGHRLAGVDLARGLGVATMIVAHTSPSAVDLPAEYLTAPLFATLIGVGLGLAQGSRGTGTVEFLLANAWRAVVLVLLGRWLQSHYALIDIVLPTLGILILALAPLTLVLHRRPAVCLGLAAVLAVVSPLVMTAARQYVVAHPPASAWTADLTAWLLTGGNYRLTSDLAFGLVGLALAAWLAASPTGVIDRAPATVAGLAVLTLAIIGGGRLVGLNTAPYSGTTAEIIGNTAYAAGTILACVWVVAKVPAALRVLAPLVSTGRVALSAYVLQVLVLMGLAHRHGPGFNDNAWSILVGLLVVCLGLGWAWVSLVRRPGPLEWVLRLPSLVSGRSGGSR